MGNISVKTRYSCCISESNLNEEEEEIATPRSVLKQPFKIENEIVESFKTLPVLRQFNDKDIIKLIYLYSLTDINEEHIIFILRH